MKYFNILVFSTIISTVSYGQIAFSTESWEDIKQRSQLEKKAIFIDVYTKWCGPCKKLDKTTFQDPDVSAYMNAHFINVKWDAESAEYRNLAKSHSVSAYPTLMFLDNDEIEIKRVVGFQNNSRLLDLAKNVLTFFNTDFLALSNALLEAPTKETIEAFLTRYEGFNLHPNQKCLMPICLL